MTASRPRTRPWPPYLTWTYDDNFTAWSAVLGEDLGAPAVSPIAAPARLADRRGLAPAYPDVGDLDIFRNEDLSYGRSLALAGVPVEFHLHPGAPHGWERFAPYAGSARRAPAGRGAGHRRALARKGDLPSMARCIRHRSLTM